jgi:hypothetical protein
MDEDEYIESIDASFPFSDEKQWRDVIEQGIAISDNAAFYPLYEISSEPAGVRVDLSNLLKMVGYWSSRYSHPLKEIVLEAAYAAINGSDFSRGKILEYLDIISKYQGMYSAISVILCAGSEEDEEIEARCNEIYKKWKATWEA